MRAHRSQYVTRDSISLQLAGSITRIRSAERVVVQQRASGAVQQAQEQRSE